ncbi:nucleotide-diphospho-sugar transferase [Phyllosticta capitalensis]|uniref:nucleotide-diphospho-sugar transferase n=1 Tax=Phyllosticta capitalensis TaxID=121624 RepID=UPI00312D3BB2
MPTGTYPKVQRSINVPPSNHSQNWNPRPRTFRRSRILAFVALLLLVFVWYSHGPTPDVTKKKNKLRNGLSADGVDWSKYAYSQYATNGAYLCNSIMAFDALEKLGSKADRILFYPDNWDLEVTASDDRDSQLLVMARDKYRVKLIPMHMQSLKAKGKEEEDEWEETWDFSINKFLAWNQTQYERVIHFDSDVTLFAHMDDLFFLPDTPVAMPRAYWELPKTRKLTSVLVVLKPSHDEYEGLMHAAYTSEGQVHRFDMEILNDRYRDSVLVLPHKGSILLTGELRNEDHSNYAGNDYDFWDIDDALAEARIVHFSDWPLPKPWIMWPNNLLPEVLPKCKIKPGMPDEAGCRDRDVWRALYDDFRQRRKDICRLLSVPAPQWPPPPKMTKPKPAKSDDKKDKKAS